MNATVTQYTSPLIVNCVSFDGWPNYINNVEAILKILKIIEYFQKKILYTKSKLESHTVPRDDVNKAYVSTFFSEIGVAIEIIILNPVFLSTPDICPTPLSLSVSLSLFVSLYLCTSGVPHK